MSSTKLTSKPVVYQDVDHVPVTSVLPNGDIPYTDHEMDADERVIVALGYKQEFKREFSLWTTFCVSFAVLGLLPSFASTLYYGNITSLFFTIHVPGIDSGLQEWVMREQQAWFGGGSSPWSLFNVLQWQWLNYVLQCRRGEFLGFLLVSLSSME